MRLLKIEWMKLRNYRAFWALTILYLVSLFAANFIAFRIQEKVYHSETGGSMAQVLVGTRPYEFPNVWHMTTYVSSFLLFIPGLLIILLVTNEYNFRTHRQNIIDGLSRNQFIGVKMMLVFAISVISTLMVSLTAIIFGLVHEAPFSTNNIQFIGYFFIQAISYGMFALLFAVLFKKAGLAIGLFFLYALVIENFIGGILNYLTKQYGRYLPLETTDSLIPLPMKQFVQKSMMPLPHYPSLLVVAALYLALYYFLVRRKFVHDDL